MQIRGQSFGAGPALRGAACEVFGDSESAYLISMRLSEGAKRMSLPVYTASEQRKRIGPNASQARAP